ncbi:MAG: trehalose-phosphatase [Candidatus Acididesulfobacter guangdongensis]|uniref:Trehalose 6-phosphate phosphatase n=1 Tax=Acididesulfobacter guangdongensis TaxID=2597225 RepID=A0A519BE95_ACIG2|nr:MAG: trehalose-phosphatase [Candidatus Acididesulfobacter guangdongensis]
MINILDNFKNVGQEIKNFKPDILVFCIDFDGTLTKIYKSPFDAVLENNYKKIIERIINIENVFFCIVTGREISDIIKIISIDNNIIYSGNHGFEIKSFYKRIRLDFIYDGLKNYLPVLKDIFNKVSQIPIKNLIIENKKYSISLHYRILPHEDIKLLKDAVASVMDSNIDYKRMFELKKGKKIIEIRPKIQWNKGKACDFIVKGLIAELSCNLTYNSHKLSNKQLDTNINNNVSSDNNANTESKNGIKNILKICMGDDLTDETMFDKGDKYSFEFNPNLGVNSDLELNSNSDLKKINVKSINCIIGEKKSAADYYIHNFRQTYKVLENVADCFVKL